MSDPNKLSSSGLIRLKSLRVCRDLHAGVVAQLTVAEQVVDVESLSYVHRRCTVDPSK